jgi:predicted RNA polymerase sigma factor
MLPRGFFVQLNRAVAIAMCDGPEAGLAHIDAVLEHGELVNYYLAHSARADMYRRSAGQLSPLMRKHWR